MLLQGQAKDRKLQPKSKHQAYVGFDDGPKAVKYYNAETRKVLITQNFWNLDPPAQEPPFKSIEVASELPHKREPRGSMPQFGAMRPGIEKESVIASNDRMEETPGRAKTHHMWGNRPDYHFLDNPFSDEKNEQSYTTAEEVYAMIARDKITSLKDAKNSPDWPK